MLTITIQGEEFFDDNINEFVYPESFVLHLEHSLVSLSKWESFHEKPFLGPETKTDEEILSYIHAMILTPDVPLNILTFFSQENYDLVKKHIDDKMTATWFNENKNAPRNNQEVITAELIYYWMTVFTIPMECENWHLNRLFTLIKIANLKQEKPKKMGKSSAAQQQRDLNAQRRAQHNTNG